jgi:hypothetical protein
MDFRDLDPNPGSSFSHLCGLTQAILPLGPRFLKCKGGILCAVCTRIVLGGGNQDG